MRKKKESYRAEKNRPKSLIPRIIYSGIKSHEEEITRQPQKIIRPKIHDIWLAGYAKEYDYNFFDDLFEGLRDVTQTNEAKDLYEKKFMTILPYFRITVFLEPKKFFAPVCYLRIHPDESISYISYKRFLKKISRNIPNLTVSKIEYTIDIFCTTVSRVNSLFGTLMDMVYVPYQCKENKIFLYNDKGKKFSPENIGKNWVYRIGNMKVYERGKDIDKEQYYWPEDKLDRVRIEYTAKRGELKKAGNNMLDDFINDPKFLNITSKKLRFKQFIGSSKLSNLFNGYPIGENGYRKTFGLEYIDANNKGVKNRSQYVKDVPEFRKAEYELLVAMSSLDREWRKRRHEIDKNKLLNELSFSPSKKGKR